MTKQLIVTADDFGLTPEVNDAVEEAHRHGVLTVASLMVGADAAEDAVNRALRLPSLRVGLHLVLVDGRPVLPPHALPTLVNEKGEFASRLFRAGVNFSFGAGVREQLDREIRAQFQAFRETGLALDHVNCHKHMQLHPAIGALLLTVGREYGVEAVRYPYEPVVPSCRASGGKNFHGRLSSALFLLPWRILLKRQLRRAGVHSNQFIFGLNDTGKMDLNLVLRLIRHLPDGITEIYFHPALRRSLDNQNATVNNQQEEELAILTSSSLKRVLQDSGIQPIAFSDLPNL